MKTKAILLTGAIALVIISCVLVAGCTSSTTQQVSSGNVNDVTGNWFATYTFEGTTYEVIQTIKPDSTGYWVVIDGSRIYDIYTSTFSNFDGNGHFDKKSSDGNTYKMTYADGTLTEDLGNDAGYIVYTKMDPIAGIWFDEGTDVITKKLAKFSHIFKADGTGFDSISNDDGTTNVVEFTWKKNDDGTYALSYASGFSNTWNVDQDTGTISTGDNTFVAKRMFANADTVIMVLGSWYNPDNSALLCFNADGTYSIIQNTETVQEGTWDIPEFGTLAIHIEKGTNLEGKDVAGEDRTWTYDRTKDTVTVQNGNVYTRTTDSVAGFTLTKFSTEPIVGQWTTKYQKNGKTFDAVMTLRNDGEGYWMLLEDVDGIQITDVSKDTWKKTGENTYQITGSSGKVFEEIYNPAADTLTEDGSMIYTRLDPIVGIWYGPTASGDGGKISTIIKQDGTGVGTVSYDNGTAEVSKIIWKKNSDGTYAVEYTSGAKRTYTIDSAGTKLTSSSGSVKQKAFLDSSFLMSMIGAWHNSDKNYSYIFNADGTGIFKHDTGTAPFTWNLKDIGKFELTYTGGTWGNGTNANGEIAEWTYDRDNNVFFSSVGIKYIRPTESINDRITLFK